MISFRITLTKARESLWLMLRVPSLPPTAHWSQFLNYIYCWEEAAAAKTPHGEREINKISTGPIDLPSEQFNSQGGGEAAGRSASSLLFNSLLRGKEVPKSIHC